METTLLRHSTFLSHLRAINAADLEGTSQEPEDLSNLMKKAQAMAVHMDKNKKDLHNKRNMQIIEARIHKLSRYYKREGVLDKKFKYEAKIASVT